jgi:putative flippase GtrA
MELWLRIPKIIRFIIIGGVNAAISYLIFAIALFLLGNAFYQVCVALQWILSSVPSYFNQKFFVFCTTGNYLKEYFKCCSTWVVSYFLNAFILEIFVRFLIKNVYVAQLFSIFTVSIVTYILFKYFAFRQKKTVD